MSELTREELYRLEEEHGCSVGSPSLGRAFRANAERIAELESQLAAKDRLLEECAAALRATSADDWYEYSLDSQDKWLKRSKAVIAKLQAAGISK